MPRLIGAEMHGREKDDFYATPPEATEALLAVEKFDGRILEPACGDGAISRVLESHGYHVTSTDLVERGYGEAGLDFLMLGYPHSAPNIITNPPFKLANQFVRRAVEITSGKVAMLLKIAFLEGVERARLFQSTPLARVWVFSKRVTFKNTKRGEVQGSGMMAFAWFVWDHSHSGAPALGWLHCDQTRQVGTSGTRPTPTVRSR